MPLYSYYTGNNSQSRQGEENENQIILHVRFPCPWKFEYNNKQLFS